MARKIYRALGATSITQSIGSIIAQSLGDAVGTNSPISSNPNLRLTQFTNNDLLALLAQRFPGLSRPITFDPDGLGIGQGGAFQNNVGWYSDTKFVDNPDVHTVEGRVKHRFEFSDSAASNGILPRGIGTGGDTIVSQPIKADQRVYFEIHMNKYPKQVDTNGVQTTYNVNGHPTHSNGAGSYQYSRLVGDPPIGLGGDVEITIAPQGWTTNGGFESTIGRAFMIAAKSMTFTEAYSGLGTGSGDYASKLNVHPTNDSDLSDINDGDIFMFAIDGSDSANPSLVNNKIYFGKNGVWAVADSNLNAASFNAHPSLNFDPNDDSAGAMGGWDMEPTEDPYHIYITPRWDPSCYQGNDKTSLTAGTYKFMDIDLTVKTGTDVTYTPPTSGRGKVFKAH